MISQNPSLALDINELDEDEKNVVHKEGFQVFMNTKIEDNHYAYAESGSDLSDSYSNGSDTDEENDKNFNSYKKISYKKVEDQINRYYFDVNHKYSSSLDIVASYLKGQKLIYMESKH